MLRSIYILVLASMFSSIAYSQGLSASRAPGESYTAAKHRSSFAFRVNRAWSQITPVDGFGRYVSAERARKPLAQIDLMQIPEVATYEALEQEFRYVRDTRFLKTKPEFPRRLTWLFPDDGCYARAEVAKFKLVEHGFAAPKKIFVFGNLVASTPNTLNGQVEWWYHVAVTYRVGTQVYVLDPSLEPYRPLKLEEWNHSVGGNQSSVQYAVCSANTFDPNSDCINALENNQNTVLWEQNTFLSLEWNRLLELGRFPEQELGDNPPWLN